ncbi:MAG: protein kinase [Hyphomicrobiaceae bacterium]
MQDFRLALPLGAVLAGDYRITGVLGQGGFGLTYKADDLRLGKPVAIKEYFPSDLALRERGSTVVARSTRDQGVLEWGRAKFLEEARTLARFRFPGIVRVARLFEANNTAYMVLDFEMGPSLLEWRQQLGRSPTQAEADHIAGRLLDAVGVVHEAGILHRDIKPANVIMRDGHEPVLIDFGAARQAISVQSRTVHAIVTPGYSPKEQYAVDLDRQGAWSDIYALGATLYFLVTGKPPPDALSRDLGEPMAMEQDGAWRPGFLAAIAKAMSVRPEDRPQSVGAWRRMLLAPSGRATTVLDRQSAARPATTAAPAPRAAAPTTSSLAQSERPRPPGPASAPRRVTFDDIPSPVEPAAEKRGSNLVAAAIVAALLAVAAAGYWVAFVAPAQDEAAWLRATAENTPAAYERYAVERPAGRHLAEARERVRVLAATVPGAAPPAVPRAPVIDEGEASASGAVVASASPPPSAPSASPPQQPAIALRATLPPALGDDGAARLAQNVAVARFRLAILAFAGDRVSGFTEQAGDFEAQLKAISGNRLEATTVATDAAPARNDLPQRLASDGDLLVWHSPILETRSHLEFTLLGGSVPFGLEPADHVRWLRSDGARLLQASYAEIGLPARVIPCGIAGEVGGWFRREVVSPSELKGLKVRGTHLFIRALRRLEVVSVGLASNRDIPRAFAENRLDAVFGVTPLTGIFLAQPRIAPVYQHPGVHSAAYLFVLLAGPAAWQSLAEPQRQLLDEACRRNLDRWVEQFPVAQADVLNRIRTQRIAVRPFTAPVREALQKAVAETLADEAGKSARFKTILESYQRFRR